MGYREHGTPGGGFPLDNALARYESTGVATDAQNTVTCNHIVTRDQPNFSCSLEGAGPRESAHRRATATPCLPLLQLDLLHMPNGHGPSHI